MFCHVSISTSANQINALRGRLTQTNSLSNFFIFLQLGFAHITDPNGYDHILFVVALCAVYSVRQWRQVLVLVTAFTIGHSVTLALATLRLVNVRTDIVELLIPITILITAVMNFVYQPPATTSHQSLTIRYRYALALGFGLIHGLGFSNYLRSLLGPEGDMITPLLAFNVGLELGQLLIVSAVLGVSFVAVEWARMARRDWIRAVSALVAFMAVSLILTNDLVAGK